MKNRISKHKIEYIKSFISGTLCVLIFIFYLFSSDFVNSKVHEIEKSLYKNKSSDNKNEENLKFVLNQLFEPSDELIKSYTNNVKNNITASVWNSTNAFPYDIIKIYNPYFCDTAFKSFCYNKIFMAYFDALNNGDKVILQKIGLQKNINKPAEYNFEIYLSYKKMGEVKEKININGVAVFDDYNKIKTFNFISNKELYETPLYRLVAESY
jgi:hypothetical protein